MQSGAKCGSQITHFAFDAKCVKGKSLSGAGTDFEQGVAANLHILGLTRNG